jgi:hypothetical protein
MGKFTFADGGVYEGNWQDDKRNGMGKFTFADGGVYEGNWQDDKRNGMGKFTFADGRVYEGEYKDDKKNGAGVFYYTNGTMLQGEWSNGIGRATWTQPNGLTKEFVSRDGIEGERYYTFDIDDKDKYILTHYNSLIGAQESKYITILINLHGSDIINSNCQIRRGNIHLRCITPVECGLSNINTRESVNHAFQIAYNVSHLNNRDVSTHDKIKKIIELFNQDNPSFYGVNSFHRPIIDHQYVSNPTDPSDMYREIFMIDTNHKTVLFNDTSYNLFNKKIETLEMIRDIENYNILPNLLRRLIIKDGRFLRSNLINVLLEYGYDTINMIDLSCRDINKRIIPRDENHTLIKNYRCDYRENTDPTTFLGDDVTSSSY